MLVLTRKQQETILVGQNITLTVIRIKGNSVQIGIDAPREVRVIRGELKRRSEPSAAQSAPLVQSAPELADSGLSRGKRAGLPPLAHHLRHCLQSVCE